MDLRYQRLGTPSPRPEWPGLVARSRENPGALTAYEEWAAAWEEALEEAPEEGRIPAAAGAGAVRREMYPWMS